jgi:hypothetical protein
MGGLSAQCLLGRIPEPLSVVLNWEGFGGRGMAIASASAGEWGALEYGQRDTTARSFGRVQGRTQPKLSGRRVVRVRQMVGV